MDKLFDISHDSQQYNSELIFVAKISNFSVFWRLLKKIEARPGVYEKSEKQKNQISIKSIQINVLTVMEQAYKVFDYAQGFKCVG